uniref:DFDF domain-containing protein n=1 Tax=Panagrolaimus superbus TaxID=310955 RepID=A0A914Z3Z1_9BILA
MIMENSCRGTSSSRFTPRENNYNSQQRPRRGRGNEFNPGNRELIDFQARYDAGVAEQKQNTFFDPEFDIDAEEEAALAASKANLFNSALENQTAATINVPTQATSNQPTIKGRFYNRPL